MATTLLGRHQRRTFDNVAKTMDDVRFFLDDFERVKLPKILERHLKVYLKSVADKLASRHGTNWPSGTTSNSLSKRSGNAISKIKGSVKTGRSAQEIIGIIGGPFYLRPHEFGATIRAKRSRYLTVPLPSALDSRGIPLRRSARDWEDTFVIKSKKGNLLIVQKRGRKIIPLYVLKKEVTIPERLGMRDEIKKGIPEFFSKVSEEVAEEFSL